MWLNHTAGTEWFPIWVEPHCPLDPGPRANPQGGGPGDGGTTALVHNDRTSADASGEVGSVKIVEVGERRRWQ